MKRSKVVAHVSRPWLNALKQSLLAGAIALIVFGPITGIVLDNYTYQAALQRPLIMALLVFCGRFVFTLTCQRTPTWTRFLSFAKTSAVHVGNPDPRLRWLYGFAFLVSLSLPFLVGKYWITTLILTLIYVLLGLGLNIVVGLAGLLDLGFVAFYAVGAYTFALGAQYFGLTFWLAIPISAMTAACFGCVLGFPVLRMHGDYLAIVTLGFGEIIRLILNNWTSLTGGPNGISVPGPTLFGLEFSRFAKNGGIPLHEYFNIPYSRIHQYIFIYCILLIVVTAALYFVTRLKRMPLGRTWEALREDEIACTSLGINPVTTKLSAFCSGAMIGGLGGVFFATYQGFINPSSFTFIESALILAIVVLGGMGSVIGVVIAASLLTLLPEILRETAAFRVLLFGLIMVLMMIWRPGGLVRAKRAAFNKGVTAP